MRTLVAFLPCLLLGLLACGSEDKAIESPEPPHTVCTLESPFKAFSCMTNAIATQIETNYERSISSNFTFSPTPEDSLDEAFTGTGAYDGWTEDVELSALDFLFDVTTKTSVTFGTPTVLINKNTFVRFQVDYSLDATTQDFPVDKTTYRGTAWIDVRNENGQWLVTAWKEIANTPGYSSWGYLRGISRLQLTS